MKVVLAVAAFALLSLSACGGSFKDVSCVPGKHPKEMTHKDGTMFTAGPMGTQWRCTDEDIKRAVAAL